MGTVEVVPTAPVDGDGAGGAGSVPGAARGVAMVGAWLDPFDPRTWSGILANLVAELERFGVFGGYHDVTPFPPLAGRVLAALDRRRPGRLQPLSAELRLLASLANLRSRRRLSPTAAGWVVPAGGCGRPVSGRVVTLSELAPGDLSDLDPAVAGSFGLPGITAGELRRLAGQQRRLHRQAHACCVASSWAAAGLVRAGVAPERVHVVGYGRNVDVGPPPDRDWSSPRFLFVGNDWHRKGGPAVLDAFAALAAADPAARLDVVGAHPRLDLPGVVGHGRLGFEDAAARRRLEELFRRATCFVMPSTLEPFGIVYVEAAAAGLPSIATTAGGTETSVGGGGLRVDPHDRRQLHDALRRLADPATARRFGEEALRRAGRFSWTAMAERVLRATGLDEPIAVAEATLGHELAAFL